MRSTRDLGALAEPFDDEEEEDDQLSYEAFDKQYGGDHSWDQLQEDETGRLRPLDATAELRARRQKIMAAARSARIRKGMIRYTLLVVDLSRAASAADMRPNRLAVMVGACKSFIRAYFDQNPLSYLSVLVMRDGQAFRLTELSGSPERQISELSAHMETMGDASLQNALDLAAEQLASVPPYGHRQVVMLIAALASVDPGDVYASIRKCKDAKISVCIVGVAAEVHVLRRATEETGGTYGVALNEGHLQELLLAHAPAPPAANGQLAADLVRMGFPQRAPEEAASAVFVGEMPELQAGGYTCPRCRARAQELPCKCHVCGLTLISSPHLARSYHHLFPVGLYEEVPPKELSRLAAAAGARARAAAGVAGQVQQNGAAAAAANGSIGRAGVGLSAALGMQLLPPWDERCCTIGRDGAEQKAEDLEDAMEEDEMAAAGSGAAAELVCYGCLRVLVGEEGPTGDGGAPATDMVLRCPQCRQLFCYECDALVHETLHNCPGCECGMAGAASGGEAAAATEAPG